MFMSGPQMTEAALSNTVLPLDDGTEETADTGPPLPDA
jgi:hypothetical protein